MLNAVCGAKASGNKRPVFVTYLNAWCSGVALRDPEYARILRQADAVYADGQSVVWASNILGSRLPERVNAADFIDDFLLRAAARGLTVYLIGSAEGVAASAASIFAAKTPGLKIAGAENGYFSGREEEVVSRIAAAAPDVLIVGLGVPLQEKWAGANLTRFNAGAVWCVGAMLEYHARACRRAPVWMRRCGLEWLFRLLLDPRRMWRRYIIGNPEFMLRIAHAWLRQKLASGGVRRGGSYT